MKHLEFVDELDKKGIAIRSTNIKNKEKVITIYGLFDHSNNIIIKDNELKWMDRDDRVPFVELVKRAIDMDTWKHSWHNEIKPENYDKFRELIQAKIIDRAEQIELLLTVYFQIGIEQDNDQ